MLNVVIKIWTLLLCLSFLIACQDKQPIEIIDTDPMDNDTLEIGYDLLWEIPLREDSIYDIGIRTLLLEDELYITRTPKEFSYLSLEEEMLCLNRNTGETIWSWFRADHRASTQPYIDEEIIAFENANNYYILDRLTGNELVAGEIAEGDLQTIRESGINSLVGVHFFGSGPTGFKNKVLEIDKQTGELDTLLVREKDDDLQHYLTKPFLYFNENGDKILFYFYARRNWHTAELHTELVKQNLTQDTLEWVLENFAYEGTPGTITNPVIKDDRIYLHTVRSVYCLDLNSGEVIWKQEYLLTNFLFSNFIINDNILNTISDEGHLIGIDIETGEELYLRDYSGLSQGVHFFEDRLYYASGSIFIVDHKTGELIHEIVSKNEYELFQNWIVINEEDRVMYAQDGKFLQAIRIPD